MTTDTTHQKLLDQLQQLEDELRGQSLWSAVAPSPEAMASTMPFMYDTLKLQQWLQWVFLPRLRASCPARATCIRWPNMRGASPWNSTRASCWPCCRA